MIELNVLLSLFNTALLFVILVLMRKNKAMKEEIIKC